MTKPWTEADYKAAGYVRLSLRMQAEDGAIVAKLAKQTGEGKGELFARLARKELEKKNRRRGVK